MNLPANPPQMNAGLNQNQFDPLGNRLPGHMLNQPGQPNLQQPLQQPQHLLQQPGPNQNLQANKPRGMSPQVHGLQGSISNQSSMQSIPGSTSMATTGRSFTDTLVSSANSTLATSSAPVQMSAAQLVRIHFPLMV